MKAFGLRFGGHMQKSYPLIMPDKESSVVPPATGQNAGSYGTYRRGEANSGADAER